MNKDLITKSFKDIQDHICAGLTEVSGQIFHEDNWVYADGDGGGRTRIFSGDTIEKGGVNFSALNGTLSEKMASKLKGGGRDFFATGVSLVIHPKNPFVPTVHMNIRYIERGGKGWFGGGIDLTPYYPNTANIIIFHKSLKNICDDHAIADYAKFKEECDDYFFIKHRNEARGVGGIFFDYLSENTEQTFDFVKDVGMGFNHTYLPIFTENKDKPFTEKQREFQLYRRGRYVEFNLVYDRGTLFGLETQGRIESILMSLPPLTSWTYNWSPEPNTPEAELYDVIKPQDWVNQ
ncbi:MAG: oxygen-dependent coproporphyrinogen oxidase [Candidatus Marinimicrobia bacterium]|nr:oxygen-dependent coproporphyrinogen oxidase [Candidatus Neomarinimicrobiota bacterium]